MPAFGGLMRSIMRIFPLSFIQRTTSFQSAALTQFVFFLLVFCFLSLVFMEADKPIAQEEDWKDEANARIEQIRKRDVEVIVVDRFGDPVPGAQVRADQIKHHFAFGSCINMNAINNPDYADFFLNHFEWAVFENASKWFSNEPMRDWEIYMDADSLYEFCEQNGIPVRGHCIFWAKEQFTPPWCRDLPEEELREEVDERIESAVNHFKNKFLHWDVNNEMLDGHFFEDRLGPDIRSHMFIQSHEIDSECKLFTNDYSIIAGSESRTNSYINQIQNLEAQGAPVHGVGVQGHFWGDTVSPYQILARLDQLSVLEKPVWVTEYDTVDSNENERADKLENLYRAAFSHPIVEGILMWGFWAGSHWRGEDAAIVELDWTLNAAGERYESLIEEWTTHAEGLTGEQGLFAFRGFHGTYGVDVQSGSSHPIVITIEVPPGEGPIVYMIPLKSGACFAAKEVEDLKLEHDQDGNVTTLIWKPLPRRTDMDTLYDTLRSTDPSDFMGSAICLESDDGSDTSAMDLDHPPSGNLYFYLIRGEYDCPHGEGPLGNMSDGTPRDGINCP